MNPQLDHFLTFANTPDIDKYVEQYRKVGFVVSDETRRYQPGLRNRFIQLGCEYLELVGVENEDKFARGGTEEFARMFKDLPTLRMAAHPFGIGFLANDVEALHQEWTLRGHKLPVVWSFAPPGIPPILSFQEIPEELLPGASCFVITYHHTSDPQARLIQRAPNTVYAVEGASFLSTEPEEAATCWQRLLHPSAPVAAKHNIYTVNIPPHTVWWMSPATFEERYGIALPPAPHRYGHLATIHLLAENLAVAATMLGKRGKKHVSTIHPAEILIASPADEDGITFIIREYPIEAWQRERSRTTGEVITFR